MTQSILVLNAGSSSVKFASYRCAAGKPSPDSSGSIDGIGTSPRLRTSLANGKTAEIDFPSVKTQEDATVQILDWIENHGVGTLSAVGHRVVHGGNVFSRPVLIEPGVLRRLEELVPLAPLHQPHNLKAIRTVSDAFPGLPQVACFDTAFHRSMPRLAQLFALPRRLTDEGIRRYGFHGLSYEYVASTLPTLAPQLSTARVVVAHLGSGASMCALRAGKSVATTMGLTPLDGLPMGTRCGAVDPGVLLYLVDRHRMTPRALEHLLYEQSGLLGLSGTSSDMRVLLASSEPDAKEAVDLFVYQIGRALGSLTAALGGIDALVFTGGIGENSAAVRSRVCRDAAWLGLDLDASANDTQNPRITTVASKVSAWIIPTDENLVIARHTLELTAALAP